MFSVRTVSNVCVCTPPHICIICSRLCSLREHLCHLCLRKLKYYMALLFGTATVLHAGRNEQGNLVGFEAL